MPISKNGARPSQKGPAEHFTGHRRAVHGQGVKRACGEPPDRAEGQRQLGLLECLDGRATAWSVCPDFGRS